MTVVTGVDSRAMPCNLVALITSALRNTAVFFLRVKAYDFVFYFCKCRQGKVLKSSRTHPPATGGAEKAGKACSAACACGFAVLLSPATRGERLAFECVRGYGLGTEVKRVRGRPVWRCAMRTLCGGGMRGRSWYA